MMGMHKACVWLLLGAGSLPCGADVLGRLHTAVGDMDIQLFSQDKPITVRNFVNYVRSGSYTNSFFHRCMPGFVVQGGGYLVANPDNPNTFLNYYSVATSAAITNEFATGRRYSNVFGTLAMAQVGTNPHSATSQWFINLANNSANLDYQNGGFTVFARVISNTNALTRFNELSTGGGGIVDLTTFYGTSAGTAAFKTLPVRYQGNTPPNYNDLYYTRIELLEAQISLDATGARVIRWNSVNGKANHVEVADGWPLTWTARHSVTGTGNTLSFTDSDSTSTRRAYRIRVDY